MSFYTGPEWPPLRIPASALQGGVAGLLGLGPVWNVRAAAFGATGDGTADDTAALHAAFDRAAAHFATAGVGGCVYFPPGVYRYNPAGPSAWFKLTNKLHVLGHGRSSVLKQLDDVGDYSVTFAPATYDTAVSDITVEGLTFDQNGAANTSGDVNSNDLNTAQILFYFRHVTGLRFLDCHFKYSGVWAVAVVNSASQDLYVGGGCRFEFSSAPSTFNQGYGVGNYDNTAIYTTAKYSHVDGCTFTAPPNGLGRGSVELHCTQGSVTGCHMDNVTAGPGLVSVDQAGDELEGSYLIAANNTVRNAMYGVYMTCFDGHAVKNVVVANNSIHIDPIQNNTYQFSQGVSCIFVDPGQTGQIKNVTVTGNTITFRYETTGRTQTPGGLDLELFRNGGISFYANVPIDNLQIVGNNIEGPGEHGILVGGGIGCVVTGAVVTHNRIENAGQNVGDGVANQDHRTALHLNLCPHIGCRYSDNVIIDRGRDGSTKYGKNAIFSLATAGSKNTEVKRNTITSLSTQRLNVVVDPAVLFTGELVDTFNPGTIAANAEFTRDIACADVEFGDYCTAQIYGTDQTFLDVKASVQTEAVGATPGTVRLRLHNYFGSDSTPGLRSYTVSVEKRTH